MANARSVVDFQINEGNFNEFLKKIEKYQATVKAMPGQWGAIGKSIQTASKTGNDFATRMLTVASAIKDAKTNSDKFGLTLKAADRTVTSLARNTATVSRNIKDATASLMKWGGVLTGFAGLLAGGGLFGISRLAQSISGQQGTARGVGASIGEVNAAGITYGQMLGGKGGVENILSNINEDINTRQGAHIKSLMGSNYNVMGKSSADILRDVLPKLKESLKSMPAGTWMNSPFVNDIGVIGKGAAAGLMNTPDKELGALSSRYEEEKKSLAISEKTATAWANAGRSLDVAGQRLENAFLNGLPKLLPGLTAFSNSFADAINTLMKSGTMKKWMGQAGEGLLAGAKYLDTPQFANDLEGLLQGIDKAGGALIDFAETVAGITGTVAKWLGIKGFDSSARTMGWGEHQTASYLRGYGNLASEYTDIVRHPEKDKNQTDFRNELTRVLQGMTAKDRVSFAERVLPQVIKTEKEAGYSKGYGAGIQEILIKIEKSNGADFTVSANAASK